MSRQVEFDKIANGFADRYAAFLESLKAAYQSRILNKNLTHKSINSLEKEANHMAALYLEGELEQVQRAEEAIRQFIATDSALNEIQPLVLDSDEYAHYLNSFARYVYNSIRHQVTKDIMFAGQQLRVETLKLANSGYDYIQLIYNYKEPQFFFNDKAGRNLPSRKYIRTMVRDFLVKSYNDMMVENIVLNGMDKVEVDHIDPNHKHYGLNLSIKEDGNDLNYFKVREDIFHPNTNAIVKVVS